MKPYVYIVEDEPLIAETIKTFLSSNGFIVNGISDSYQDALESIKQVHIDLVLLDINLEGDKDGVDIALFLDEIEMPYMYITSQTDAQSIARVKLTKPLGYIAKPFTQGGLISNIEIAWNTYKLREEKYLTFSTQHTFHRIKQSKIKYLKAYDNYCYVVTTEDKFLIPKTMKYLAELLDLDNFIKTHRSYYVNVGHVNSIEKDHLVVGNDHIPISNSNKNMVKHRFGQG